MKFALSPDLSCDLDRLVYTRLLAQANSGGGKSFLLRRLLEQTFGKVQHLVLDPEGEFSTLREKHDYVLVAKSGGEVAADPRTARLLAERLLDLHASAILDIYELSPRDRVLFVKEFLEGLVEAPKRLWHPVLVIVDEAHNFAPEKGDAESADAVKALATKGRKRGFCAVLATQRLSKLSKDVAAEMNNKLIGRTGLDVDVKRAVDELGLTKTEGWHLRDLEAGEFLAFGPALCRKVTKVKVGPVFTTHPEAGDHLAAAPAPPPSAKVKALLSKLSDLPAEVEKKRQTEDSLRAEISRLQATVRVLEKATPPVLKETVREVEVVDPETLDRLRTQAGIVKAHGELLEGLGRDLIAVLDRVARAPSRKATKELPTWEPRQYPPAASQGKTPSRLATKEGALTGPERRILDSIAWLNSLGVEEPEVGAVAFGAEYTSTTGGAFANPKSRLRTKGFIEYRGDRLILTEEGRRLAPQPDNHDPQTMRESLLQRLKGPMARILGPLLEAYPEPIPNERLAELAGYTSTSGGAYANPRGRLRTLGLIEYRDGAVRARDILFPEQ